MNILFLTCWYPSKPYPGKGIFIKEHAAAIQKAGHNVMMLALVVVPGDALFHAAHEFFEDEYGIPTHLITISSRYHKKVHGLTPLLYRQVRRCFLKNISLTFTPDLVHSNVLHPAAVMGHKLAKRCGVPHVISEHWSKAGKYMDKNPEGRLLGRKVYNAAAAITVVSKFLRDSLAPYIRNTGKITVIPNIIDTGLFSYRPKPASPPLVFAAVAAWISPKRPDLLVQALEHMVKEQGITAELHFFGEGPQLDEIRKQQFSFTIHFRGYSSKTDIAAQLQQTHFFLHASEVETFSIVVAEALSTGTPVIASARGALPELVDAGNGVLCENTVEAWTAGLRKALATHYASEQLAGKMGARFSAEAVGKAFDEVYRRITVKNRN